MSELTKNLKEDFKDKETRHIYAEDFLNTLIATQLKVLREDRQWTQTKLAEEAEMKQERISVLEDVNYESWSVKTLKRLAKAFDLRLSIKFETFGSFLKEFEAFNRETLQRPSFEDDPAFSEESVDSAAARVATASATPAGGLGSLNMQGGATAIHIHSILSFNLPTQVGETESVGTSSRRPLPASATTAEPYKASA